MKSLIGRMMLSAALALTASTAMAAGAQVHKAKTAVYAARAVHAAPAKRLAARRLTARQRVALPNAFQMMFGWPGANSPFGWSGINLPRVVVVRGRAANEYTSMDPPPSYDSGPPANIGAEAQQAAQDAIARANQDIVNNAMEMAATQAAVNAQQAQDTANTLQTEINAGM